MTDDKDLQNALRVACTLMFTDKDAALAIRAFYSKETGKLVSFQTALSEWKKYDALRQAIRVVFTQSPDSGDSEAISIIKQLYARETGEDARHEVVLREWEEYTRLHEPRTGREFENN